MSLKSWPPTARNILLDSARWFYSQMREPFAVYDVEMDQTIEYTNRELERRQSEIYEEASSRWISRWEHGELDDEMKKVIGDTYGKLRRAERGISRSASKKSAKKKSPTQLDVEIAQSLAEREVK